MIPQPWSRAACNGSLLTTKPDLSNLSPFVPCNQRIPFSGKGLNGQSVAPRTAKTATAQTAFARFPVPGIWTCSFTGETLHMTLRRQRKSVLSVDKTRGPFLAHLSLNGSS